MTKHQTRFMQIDNSAINDDRKVNCAISSTAPVKRGRKEEVLLHGPGNVDLTFLSSGRAPVLMDHVPTRQVGVIESVTLDSKAGVLRATLRLSQSADATNVLQDIRDGIRSNISIGYQIDQYDETESQILVTRWTPIEVSIVSIPADMTVGIGRSRQSQKSGQSQMNKHIGAAEAAEIMTLGFKHGMDDKARDAVRNHQPLADFRAYVLNNLPSNQPIISERARTTPVASETFDLGNFLRGRVTGDWRGAEFEHETSAEMTRSANGVRGHVVPVDALATRAAMTTGVVAAPLQAVDLRGDLFIQALLPSSVCLQAGAQMLSGLTSNVSIPREATAPAATWVAESGAIAEGNPVFGSVTLNATMLAARVTMTRKSLLQSIPSLDAMVKRSIARQFAVAVDKAAISGSGTAPVPRGIENILGINAAAAIAGGAVSYQEVLNMWRAVAEDNVAPDASMSFLMSPLVARILRNTTTFTANGGVPILGDMDDRGGEILAGRIMGRPAFETTHVTPSVLLFGKMNEMIIGQFGGLDIVVDETSGAANGEITIWAYSFWDIAFRNGAQAFAKLTGI
jgi:HK97 family phage major capsid protein/HK97 family phage prohead protease